MASITGCIETFRRTVREATDKDAAADEVKLLKAKAAAISKEQPKGYPYIEIATPGDMI